MMTTRSARAVVCWSAVVAVSTALAACSPSTSLLGLTPNTAVLSSRPAVTVDQATTIAGRALGEVQRADAVRTPEAARGAFVGLSLQIAQPRYVAAGVSDPTSRPGGALTPPVQPLRIIVTAGRDFPRTIVAVWRPVGSSVHEVAVLDSPGVRSPFRVSAQADLLPGIKLPPTAPNTRGASRLGANVDNLASPPPQVVKDFANLMQTGRSSSTQFAPSPVVEKLRTTAVTQAKEVASVGSLSRKHWPQPQELRVIRTADGGAIVVGSITRTDTFWVRKGAGRIDPSPVYQALSGGRLKQINQSAVVRTVQVVVFVVPRKGNGPVQVVGFSETPVAVTGS